MGWIGETCTGRSMEGEYVRLGNSKQKTGKTASSVIACTYMDAVIAHYLIFRLGLVANKHY